MDSGERLARSCQSFPLPSNAGCTYLGLSDSTGRLNARGTRIKVPHQHVVLGDRDVVGMHGKPDALLHLRGESPRLTGALAPLLPRAPEQMGTEMDRVKMQPGLNSEDIGGAITSDRMSALYPLVLHRWESLRNHP